MSGAESSTSVVFLISVNLLMIKRIGSSPLRASHSVELNLNRNFVAILWVTTHWLGRLGKREGRSHRVQLPSDLPILFQAPQFPAAVLGRRAHSLSRTSSGTLGHFRLPYRDEVMSDFGNNRILGRVLRNRVDETVRDFVGILGLWPGSAH